MYISYIDVHDSVLVSTTMIKLLLENGLISDEEVSEIEQMDDEYKVIESLIHKVTCEKNIYWIWYYTKPVQINS